MLQLPLKTNIPLDVLNANIEDTFPGFTVRTANVLGNVGIERNWQLLVQTEASLLKVRNFERECLKEVNTALASKNWRLGALVPYDHCLLERIDLGYGREFLAVYLVGPDRETPRVESDEVRRFLTSHGLHTNMRIDELFVYVPTERPPLTEAQVAFLRTWPQRVFTSTYELTWCQVCFNLMKRDRVLDIALMLPHLRHDDVHKDVIARIRARIEAEVGPLPLALSSDELKHFFR